jgi:hypothetical protein
MPSRRPATRAKLRSGSYFPDWLLGPRKRSEQALVAARADAYLAGVSTRRVDKLLRTLGIEGISKSEVSRLAASLDELVGAFRNRPLEGVYPYLMLDALVVKVREGGRICNVAGPETSVDSAAVLLRLDGGAVASAQIASAAPGHGNTIQLEAVGNAASVPWEQEDPDRLWYGALGKPVEMRTRHPGLTGVRLPATLQIPRSHPQGYLDAFRDLMAWILPGDRWSRRRPVSHICRWAARGPHP